MAQLIDTQRVSPECTPYENLLEHLEDEYQMPPEKWWQDVDTSFDHLRTILERCPQEVSRESHDLNMVNASMARAGALPIVTVVKSGNHLLKLAAKNEDLQCIAFGTISPQIYVEIFWEAVSKSQEGGSPITVHKFQEAPACCWFQFEGHDFWLLYVQCEDLVRSYPDIVGAPDSFLEDSDDGTRELVRALKRDRRGAAYFDKVENARESYHYVRAWAITRGLFWNGSLRSGLLKPQDIVKILTSREGDEEQYSSAASNILYFFQQFGQNPSLNHLVRLGPNLPSGTTVGKLLELLQALENDSSLDDKMEFSHYVQVKVSYWGRSDLAGAKWLSMVERRLIKLKDRIETNVSKFSSVYIWPHRLVTDDNTQSEIYNGYYVIGLQLLNARVNLPLIQNIADKWTSQVETDRDTVLEECSITTTLNVDSDFKGVSLRPCTRVWPRQIILGDPNHRDQPGHSSMREDDDFPKTSKVKKHLKAEGLANIHPGSEAESTKKLRSAADVLNRLKYDRIFNLDEFKVGYMDRHSKILEKPVAAWVKETTDEEWIPEHRIMYFKRYPASGNPDVLWDRAARVDKIFGGSAEL